MRKNRTNRIQRLQLLVVNDILGTTRRPARPRMGSHTFRMLPHGVHEVPKGGAPEMRDEPHNLMRSWQVMASCHVFFCFVGMDFRYVRRIVYEIDTVQVKWGHGCAGPSVLHSSRWWKIIDGPPNPICQKFRESVSDLLYFPDGSNLTT